jgi:DNA-binding beta-propeller fold protein YncE
MLRKKPRYVVGCLLFLGLFFRASTWSWADEMQSPWKFLFSLQGQGRGMALPVALYVDHEKARYYVVDSTGNRLLSFAGDGKFLQEFTAEGNLKKPYDMARLADGSLLVVEKGRNSLTRVDLKNKKTTPLVITQQGREVFVDRLEVAGGKVYVLDRSTGRILQLDETLQVAKSFAMPEGAGWLADFKVVEKRIWALDQKKKQIYSYDENGRPSPPVQLTGIDFPVSLAVDPAGLFYILDRHKGAVVVLGRNGEFKYSFLTKGQGRQNLYFPQDVRFDHLGRLCVVDEGNSRVMVFKR